ncbi:MAG: hypothetical protein ABFR47_06810 [Verrucomicrobiota bacterium]
MKKHNVVGLVLAGLMIGGAQAQELNQEQEKKLGEVALGFSQQATVFEGLMKNKLTELALELQREGRLDTEEAAAEAATKVNGIMKDLSGLYGEFIKTKVQYILKTKNVLTDEQKIFLLSQLQPSESLPYETIVYLQPETFDLPLNLSLEQKKKIVELEAALLLKETEHERDIELIMLELQPLLLSGQPQPEKVDPLVMKLAGLAAQAIDNRVDFFLKAKDVLDLDQKRLLVHMMGLD